MFCPKCGNANQTPETYCRQCGIFLPDLSKPVKREHSAEEHLKANTVLSVMTIVTCFTLAILLYLFFGFRPNTPPLIYVTAGLLIAMGGWHVQTFIRTRLLKKQWKKISSPAEAETDPDETQPTSQTASTARLLDQADFESVVPASVTENTTRLLAEKTLRSSQPKH